MTAEAQLLGGRGWLVMLPLRGAVNRGHPMLQLYLAHWDRLCSQAAVLLYVLLLQVPLQYQQQLLDSLDGSAATVEEVDNSSSTSTVIAQVSLA